MYLCTRNKRLCRMSNRREKNKPRNIINKQLEQPGLTMKEKDDNLIQLGKFFLFSCWYDIRRRHSYCAYRL